MDNPIRVLVVDDDDDVRETLELVLETAGFQVSSACDGARALEQLRAATDAPVVLLDLRMPVMSGWDVIDTLRAEGKLDDIAIIICTSSPRDAPVGFEIVTKPVDLAVLTNVLRRAAERRGDARVEP
ncbi:MAG TPA: response regulator [Kofleriaceae bacterium]|nr:response regulator [Kofleriaceae bacterium]